MYKHKNEKADNLFIQLHMNYKLYLINIEKYIYHL